ncbi:MAG: hypothetical protein ACLQDY_15400 [Streptosporangiaceae bacterium]
MLTQRRTRGPSWTPTLVVPAWRRRGTLAAIAAGLAAGAAEWAGETWAFYCGPAGRLRLTAREPPKFSLYFSLPRQIRNLAGGCSPRYCPPWLGAWWAALLILAILGIITARRRATRSRDHRRARRPCTSPRHTQPPASQHAHNPVTHGRLLQHTRHAQPGLSRTRTGRPERRR